MTVHQTHTTDATSRRNFLRNSVVAAAAAGTGLLAGNSTAAAADKITRNGKPYMKLSLAAYSYREYLMGAKAPMTLEDFIKLCADLNLDGCELTSYYFPKDFKDDYLLRIKELTFRLGLDISGTAIANDFCLVPGPAREETLAHTKKWIDNAALMGAPVIRIFAGKAAPGSDQDTALELCIAGINECLVYAAEKGVFLALENHGGITATPEMLLKIVQGVKPSPWFGVNFDSGNFETEDPYSDLAKIAPYAVNAQVKVEIKRKPETKADLARLVKILQDANYRGYLVLEYESKTEDAKTGVPKYVEELRKVIAG